MSAYYLVSAGHIQGQSKVFQSMNIVAAICVGGNAAWRARWPAMGVNIIWLIIGFSSEKEYRQLSSFALPAKQLKIMCGTRVLTNLYSYFAYLNSEKDSTTTNSTIRSFET